MSCMIKMPAAQEERLSFASLLREELLARSSILWVRRGASSAGLWSREEVEAALCHEGREEEGRGEGETER